MTHLDTIARWISVAILAAVVADTRAWAEQAQADSAPPASKTSARLADPAVAQKLKLTDLQRMKISALEVERAESLAKVAPDARAEVAKQFEEKFLAVLSDEQRAELAATTAEAKKEPKLRFNFRFQRWSDVLEWFAEQADLSLVFDAPPPGTFNYSDDREYSVAESLDLLNGVLLTKGYTLLRRERMLILIDLSQGIPETLVPRVGLDELDKRGRFEIVSVLFPRRAKRR